MRYRKLKVKCKRFLTDQVCEFELVTQNGTELPKFTAGSHINIQTPSGKTRSYSLSNNPTEKHRYIIAVKTEDNGRGGSLSMNNILRQGDDILVSNPIQNFPLKSGNKYILIAGGIGITPILSMVRVLNNQPNADFKLIYLSRHAESAPYLKELSALKLGQKLIVHFDQGRQENLFDFEPHFDRLDEAQIYCCGPKPLMDYVKKLTSKLPKEQVNFEDFIGISKTSNNSQSFMVEQHSTGDQFEIPHNKSIIEVLDNYGF